jgi:hypothetical protein
VRVVKEDLVGKKFGELEVLSRTLLPNTKKTAWFCKCSCGTEKIVRHQSLLRGSTKSCGCGIGKATSKRWEKKIRKGSRFGRLKVLDKTKQDKWGNWLYECMCACGKTHTTKGTGLRCGKIQSCGCAQIEAVTTHGLSQTKAYRREKSIQAIAKRRALQHNLKETFSVEEIENLQADQHNRCYYCKTTLTDFHRDHKTPLCRKGRNTIANIALACPPCNLKKNKKTAKEFLRFLSSCEGKEWLSVRNKATKRRAA